MKESEVLLRVSLWNVNRDITIRGQRSMGINLSQIDDCEYAKSLCSKEELPTDIHG